MRARNVFSPIIVNINTKEMVVERCRCTQNIIDTTVKIPYSGFCCYLKHHKPTKTVNRPELYKTTRNKIDIKAT